MTELTCVVGPSELPPPGVAAGTRILVGGRVEWSTTDEVVLADALGSIRVRGAFAGASLGLGSLAVLALRWTGSSYHCESVEYAEQFPAAKGNGEWAVFAWEGQARRLALRHRVRRAIRDWFDGRAFIETETPTWLRAPGLDSGVDVIAAEHGWLVTSPELGMKRLLVGGLPRIYQLAKCFRKGEQGPRHEQEFTMLEWYRAFSSLDEVLDDTESLVVAAARSIGLEDELVVEGTRISLERPFLRLSVEEAFRRHAGVEGVDELARQDRDQYFQLFVDRVEPSLRAYDRPVFLYAYPAVEAALARLDPKDPRWAQRAELYIAGIELCNAYAELNAADEQRARFVAELERRAADGNPTYPLDERFLAALEQGMPPAAGNALGFDRLMMLLLGATCIKEVIAFPGERV